MTIVEIDRELSFEDICRIVVPIAVKHGMERVYLFGSRAREDHDGDSDYDFLVVPPAGCGAIRLGSFWCDLEEALGSNVDIITEGAVHRPSFIEEVLHDRRLIFEA